MNNTSSYYNIIERLEDLKSYYTKNRLLFGILLLLTSVFALGISAFFLSSVFVLPTFIRIIYLGLFFLFVSVLVSYFLLRVLIYKPSLESLALKVEKKYPQLKNRLIASLQLFDKLKKNPFGYSTDMIEALLKQADEISSRLDFKKVVDKNPLKKVSKITVGLVLIFIMFAFVFPGSFNFCFYVFSHPLTEIEIPQKFNFIVFPGDLVVSKFSDVKIKIKTEGEKKPEKIKLIWRNEGGSWNKEDLRVKGQGSRVKGQGSRVKGQGARGKMQDARGKMQGARGKMQDERNKDYDFSYTFKEVKRSFYYYVKAEDIKSQEYRITVVDKPRVIGLKLLFDYPSYTGLQDVVLDENDGNITAIFGTKVKIEAKANKKLDKAKLVFKDFSKKMEVKKNKAISEILIKKDNTYHIELQDSSGYKNEDPIEYQIISIPDEYPQIKIIEPAQDQDLNERMELYLVLRIADDYGFSSLNLVYQIISGGVEGKEKTLEIPLDKIKGKEAEVGYLWDLDRMGLVPEDVVKYRVDVYDNDEVSGPKKSSSKTFRVRLPSLAEILKDLDRKREEQILDMEKVFEQEKELQEKLKDFSKKMLKDIDVDWAKKKQMEEFLKTQEKIQEKLKELSESIDQTGIELEENKLATLELFEKMQELKKLLDEIATPELKEAMRKLQEALDQLDPEKVKEALAKMEFSLEEMIKKLDRTISLLKRLKAEQKLENLIEWAKRLSQKQKEIGQNVGTCDKKGLKELSFEESELLEELNELEDELKDWGELTKELEPDLEKEIDELLSFVGECGVKKDMGDLESSLFKGEKQKALESSGVCESKLSQLIGQMKLFKALLQKSQMADILNQMRRTLFDLFYLSDKQESLFNQTSTYENRDFALRGLAKDEQDLKSGALRVENDLEELSKKTYFISSDIRRQMSLALASMDAAVKRLDEINKDAAVFSQKDAIYNLNQTAKKLLEAFGFASGSCSCSGLELMFGQMEKLAQSQAMINEKTLGFGDLFEKLTLDQQKALQRLAGEQEAIRKSVEQLAKEFGDRKEILGSLEDLEKHLTEVVKDMESQNVSERTIRLQERILSRLLDAEKSLARRDYSKKRKAEIGEDIYSPISDKLPWDLAERDRLIKENLQKILKESYPKEYEKLILEYFRRLSEGQRLEK